MQQSIRLLWKTLIIVYCLVFGHFVTANTNGLDIIDEQIAEHEGKSGVYILDKGEQALLARAWLADHAQESIEVQYFIWSTDNIGILASEALLRAAKRGVNVRVIVDDLLIDAPDKSLLALASHPNIHIRIYNPKHSVGTSFFERVMHIFTDFRGVNQRMHDKTFIVDEKVAITGGRNITDEYFDYNHTYNFRDRDALVIGPVVADIQKSFNRFWKSQLSEKVEQRFKEEGVLGNDKARRNDEVQKIYQELHRYAQSTGNFEKEVRDAIANLQEGFMSLAKEIVWTDVQFISDKPGKNDEKASLGGGGLATTAIAEVVKEAKEDIVIQSPYLVLSDEAKQLFSDAIRRGVKITISTNSLASTDNLQAFSGYKNQRSDILKMGIQVSEFKPHPDIQKDLLERYPRIAGKSPVFALHAKTMVVDSKILYVGTYNLDPRSQNLNTEVGIIVNDETLASSVKTVIEKDMEEGNSWKASASPDQHAGWMKRIKVGFWQLMPLEPLL